MFYQNTNKKNPAGQLAAQEQWYTCIQRQQGAYDGVETSDMMDAVKTAPLSLQCHHHMSDSPRNIISLAEYLAKHRGDPALEVRAEHPT